MTLLISKSPADPPQWKGKSFSKNEWVKRTRPRRASITRYTENINENKQNILLSKNAW